MKLVVQRGESDSISTPGELFVDGQHFCYTLEPQKPTPAGTYDLTIRQSPRFGRLMPHIENVPGYTGILVHWGNWAKDTEGCTLVGETEGEDFIGHSVDEFNKLFRLLQDGITAGGITITYLDPISGNVASGAGGGDFPTDHLPTGSH